MSFLKERRLPSLKEGSEEATIKGFFRCVQWGSQHKSRKPHNSLETISLSLPFPFPFSTLLCFFLSKKEEKNKKTKILWGAVEVRTGGDSPRTLERVPNEWKSHTDGNCRKICISPDGKRKRCFAPFLGAELFSSPREKRKK